METRKFCFGVHPVSAAMLARTLRTHEALGATCTIETTFETHHHFELHTLVCEMPKKLHPVKFTRAGE